MAFIFCDRKLPTQGSANSVLCPLLYPMIVASPPLVGLCRPRILEKVYTESLAETLSEWLSAVILQARGIRLWLIVDASDELPEQAATLFRRFLHNQICNDLVGRLKILVSDRSGPTLSSMKTDKYIGSLKLDVEEIRTDVHRHVEHIFEQSKSDHNISEAPVKQTELGILTQSKGMFLFASLNGAAFSEGVSY
jgi:hypothetical protein